MSKRRYTENQISELVNNQNVVKCSNKSITYKKEFRLEAVRRYQEDGTSAREIFKGAGFNLELIGNKAPTERLKSWRRIVKKRGADALLVENRGCSKGVGKGRPRTRGLTDADKIKRLEITVAYLKAENDFLAKLRAKRAE